MMTSTHMAVWLRLLLVVLLAALGAGRAAAQSPLEITVAGGQFKPIPIAISSFEATGPDLGSLSARITDVVERDLESSGLFDVIPRSAFVSGSAAFASVPQFADWRTINADALVTGRVQRSGDGRVQVQLRIYDTAAEQELEGLQFLAPEADWRRIAHKTADAIYTELTGEGPYFDSRVAFIDETGSKGNRVKRLAMMDQDGANVRYLGPEGLVLTPRFSPDNRSVLYTSWDTGSPQVFILNTETGQRERLGNFPGMSFAPRFAPDGRRIVFSITEGGNSDIYEMQLGTRSVRRLTNNPAIDTSGSYSPDGSKIVFESDRGGTQQLYVMPAGGGEARRISFGSGTYGTPVWSPRGDLVAFTKILGGRFHIGVMRADGSDERLLSSSFLDEGPTWAPNGRVLMFFRQSPGQAGRSQLMSVDVSGRNLQVVETPNLASDPAWSPVRE